jgi:hypothetical protein
MRPPLELTSLNAHEIADHATNEDELENADALESPQCVNG